MAIIAKMYIYDLVINLIEFSIKIKQGADETGHPSTKSQLQTIWAVFETTKDVELFAWSISSFQLKQVTVILTSAMQNGKSKKYEFFDVVCTFYKEGFNGVNSDPALTTIGMEAAIFKYGNFYHEKYWKVTDIHNQIVPIVNDENNEKEIVRYYITDLERNRLNNYDSGDKILVHIVSRNMIGEQLTFSLNDKTHDFKYNGNILENDTLRGYIINNDLEQIELEVIDQQN